MAMSDRMPPLKAVLQRRFFSMTAPTADGTGSPQRKQCQRPPSSCCMDRGGAAMLDIWQGVGGGAAVLIAPDALDPAGSTMAQDGPDFLTAVLAEAARAHPIDPGEVYLMGHSAGANHALRLANRSGPWRAVAVHAGGRQPRRYRPATGWRAIVDRRRGPRYLLSAGCHARVRAGARGIRARHLP
jgi:pimeloyl-ACP methyl ester carboxylesterase